ncbi:MAG: tandem-95 repeat protein, partial [Rhodospirillaceae bacterium]|nr:tandem-95 repeat protein [Rhodospirillaceae bacterium]
GVLVGVVDDGVEYSHSEFLGAYRGDVDYDYGGNDADAAPGSGDSHGTAVAGLIGARADGQGTIGVAFESDLTSYRIFGGTVTTGEYAAVYRHYSDGVDIFSNSWGYNGFFYDDFDGGFSAAGAGVNDSVAHGRDGLGSVILFAAGNDRQDGQNVNYHGFQNARETIAVAAIDNTGEISYYSTPGAGILIGAPSNGGTAGIVTTDRAGGNGYDSGDYTYSFGGTSAATPIASGVVALMLEANADLGYRDVQEILAYSARQVDVSDPGWAWNGAANWNGGGLHVSHDFGFGLIDAHAAVRLAETWDPQSTRANETVVSGYSAPNRSIIDNGTIGDTITIASGLDIDHVEVRLNIDHSWIGDLVVTLTSPDGTVSTLVDRPGVNSGSAWGSSQDDIRFTLDSTHHWGETGEGAWTLSVADHYAADSGILENWTLSLYGDTADADDTYVYTDEFGAVLGRSGQDGRAVLSDAGGTDTINAAAVTLDATLDLRAGASSSLAGGALTIAEGTLIEDAYLGDGADRLTGNEIANRLDGGRGNDAIDGGAGDDLLIGGAGDDVLTGGEGIDTAWYGSDFLGYSLTYGTDWITISGGEGTDWLSGIEWLRFADQTISTEFIAAVDDSAATVEDQSLTIQAQTLLANDTAPSDGTISVVAVAGASSGSVLLSANGDVVYTPDQDFSGTDSFTYSIRSGSGATSTATVSVTVDAVADQPSLYATAGTPKTVTAADGSLEAVVALGISAVSTDSDGSEALTVTVSGLPDQARLSQGEAIGGVWHLTESQLPGLTMSLPEGTAGSFELSVTARATEAANGDYSAVSSSITIDLSSVAPEAMSASIAVVEDGSATDRVIGADFDGGALAFTAYVQPEHGLLQLASDGTYTYTPDQDYFGTDAFSYVVSDGAGSSDPATVSITVSGVNDRPVAAADNGFVAVGPDHVFQASALLANDADVDGDILTIGSVGNATGGTVSLTVNGSVRFQADDNFEGAASFDYIVEDGQGGTASANVELYAVNPDGLLPGTSSSERLLGTSGEDVFYGFGGSDRLEGGAGDDRYVFGRGDGQDVIRDDATETTTSQVWVASGYTRSTPNYDTWIDTSHWETRTTVVEADGGDDTLAFGLGIGLGDVALRFSGSDLLIGLVDPSSPDTAFESLSDLVRVESWSDGYDRVESLRFSDGREIDISDLSGAQEALGSAGVTLVGGAGQDWLAGGSGDDVLVGAGGDDVLVGGGGEDTARYGGVFADYTVSLGGSVATVSGAEGTDLLAGVELLSFSDFTLFADGRNNAPVASGETVSTSEDTALSLDLATLLSNDADVDGYALTIASVGSAVHGTVALSGGSAVFTPDADYAGTAFYAYTVDDGQGGQATAAVTITVTPVNDAPRPAADSATTDEDISIVISASSLLANDTDVEGDSLSLVSVSASSGGNAILDGAGDVVFTPDADFNGAAEFTYVVSDGAATTSSTVTIAVASVNDAPVGTEDQVTSIEDTALTISASTLLANDSDVDGDSLQLVSVSGGQGGTATLNGQGDIVFTPDTDFAGLGSFAYTVEDGNGGQTTAAVSVTVLPVNDAPVIAGPLALEMDEDGTLSLDQQTLTQGASDVDGNALDAIGLVLESGPGSLSDLGGGSWAYVPTADFNGAVEFSYSVSDGLGGLAQGSAFLAVRPVNDAPEVGADAVGTTEDVGLTISLSSLLANDWDVEGDPLSVTAVAAVTGGSVALDQTGGILFTPEANFSGSAQFTYTVSDGQASTDGTVTVSVEDLEDPPEATDDQVSVQEDQASTILALDLLANDHDPDGDTLSISSVDNAVNGTVELDQAGNPVFTPDAEFSGTASFSYTASDGRGGSSSATVTIQVAAVNDVPIAAADGVAAIEDTPITIASSALLQNDVDIDSSDLSISAVQASVGAQVELDPDGNVLFTPEADFTGDAAFTYTVSDGDGGTATGTVSVVVSPVNDAPAAQDDVVQAVEDTALTISSASLLANDSDAEGDAVSLVAVGSASGGTAMLDGDGNVLFTPIPDFAGSGGFTYVAADSNGATSTAQVVVQVAGTNDAPTAGTDALSAVEDNALAVTAAELLANDGDIDNDTLAVSAAGGAVNGSVTLDGAGGVVFTPDADFVGTASFVYTISDGHGGSATAAATIDVASVNDAPSATADTLVTAEDVALSISAASLLSNDTDVEGDALAIASVGGAVGGIVALDGSGSVVFTPNADYHGTAHFSYVASDGQATSSAVVSVTVLAVNDAPLAQDGGFLTDVGMALTSTLSATDVDGDELTYTLSAPSAHGTTTVSADGTFVYTPGTGYFGDDGFSYAVSDGIASTTATVTITVNAGNLISGTSSSERLVGTSGADVFYGFGGSDRLEGGAGDDRYVFGRGDGRDVIRDDATETTTSQVWVRSGYTRSTPNYDTWIDTSHWESRTTVVEADGGDDTLAFGLGIGLGDVALRFSGSDLLIGLVDPSSPDTTFGSLSDLVRVESWSDGYDRVESLRFSDGREVDISDLTGAQEALGSAGVTLVGGAGEDWLAGGSGDDVLVGAGGDDVLVGGGGEDTARYGGVFADYTVTLGGSVATVSGAEGTDLLAGVELLSFSDFTVFADGRNNAPVALGETVSTSEDTALTLDLATLLSNDADVDGNTLTVASVGSGIHGTATLSGDTVVFVPDADYAGTASYAYTVDDGQGGQATATVSITVTPVNDAPVLVDRVQVTVAEDETVDISDLDLAAAVLDADGDLLTVSGVTLAGGPGTLNATGIGSWSYAAPAEYSGTVRLLYSVSDGTETVHAEADISVVPVNDPPVTSDDTAAGVEDTPVTIAAADVLANDTDIEGQALSLLAVGDATSGSVSLDANGDILFTPEADYSGTAAFVYTVADSGGATATATVVVSISGTPDAPIVSESVQLTTAEDEPLSITRDALLANAVDADGDVLSVLNSTVTGGSGSLEADGLGGWRYTPPADWSGSVRIDYQVSDGTTAVAAAALLTVTPQNDAPVAVSDLVATNEDTVVSISASALLANDSDVEGDSLAVVSVGDALGGSVTLGDSGEVIFTPVADFHGTGQFAYLVSDGQTSTAGTVIVEVAAVNDAPVTAGQTFITDIGVSLSANLSASDADGDSLNFALNSSTAHGSLNLASDGGFLYQPTAGYFGDDSFSYMVDDGFASAVAIVSLTINPANLVAGTSGIDTLLGGGEDNVLYGYEGADSLFGGAGNDRYMFGRGDGRDLIHDESTETATAAVWVQSGYWHSTPNYDRWIDTSHWESRTVVVEADAGHDTLGFASGIDLEDILLRFSGSDLHIGIADPQAPNTGFDDLTDMVTVQNWLDEKDRIETLQFGDGREIDISGISHSTGDVFSLTSAMSSDLFSDLTQMSTDPLEFDDYAGANVLDGSAGDDLLFGGAGADRFLVSPNTGSDTIQDFTVDGPDRDVIELRGAGIDDFESLSGFIVSDGQGNTLIQIGDAVLTLVGVDPIYLGENEFVFG